MPRRRRSAEDAAILEGMGLAIAKLRENRDLSKSALATMAEIAPSTLGEIELGKTDAKWGTLRRLASALEIPLDTLIELAEELASGIDQAALGQRSKSPSGTSDSRKHRR